MWVVGSLRGVPSRQLAVALLLLLLLWETACLETAVVPLLSLLVTVLSTQPVEQRHAVGMGERRVGASRPPSWSSNEITLF